MSETPIFRKEIKYVISIAEFLRLQPWLEQMLHADVNGEEGEYTIRSLYYDSIYDRDLYDNLDGVREKRKIRLRAYLPDLSRAKLECKAKDGSDGIKYAVWVNRKEMEALINGEYSCLTKSTPAARRIYQRMVSGGYHPKTIVEYHRKAYIHDVSNTRITFDTKIRGTVTGNGFFEEYPGFIPMLPDSQGVLEIKYDQFCPYPIAELMKTLDRLPSANSKYTQARSLI